VARVGAFLKRAFGAPPADAEAVQRVKDWARTALRADDDTVVTVNEIVCADPACPGLETVILVMAPGVKTRACKIAKGLSEIAEADIVAALEV
jgi:hypothetical protein